MSYKAHWKFQRLTALLLVLIYPCFIAAFYHFRHVSYGEIIHAFSDPFFVALIIMSIMTVLYHAVLGLQVIIEDYVKSANLKAIILFLLKIIGIIAFVFTFASLIKLMILGTQL